MAEIASAFVTIAPSMKGFRSEVTREAGRSGDDASRTFGSRMNKQGRGIGRAFGKTLALGITAAAGAGAVLLRGSISEAIEAQKVGAATTQIIKATGGAAKISAKQVGDLATALSNKVGVDDEAIQTGANLLLTFKNVRNEAGKGADIFNRATAAAVDLSAAGFGSIESGSKMLGKALNDPVKGISALSRAGVTFSEGQKQLIKDLVASGKTLEAQKVILREVEGQVGGTAAATATSGEKMRVAWGNLQEEIGTALLPVLNDLAHFGRKEVIPLLQRFSTYLNENRAQIRATAQEWGGKLLGALGDVWAIAKPVLSALNDLPGPLKTLTLQAGLAAAVLPRMTAGLLSARAAASSFATSVRSAETRTAALGSAARGVAGAGGLLAIAQGAQTSDKAVRALATTAGGAALGFSMAGPWGAAVGAVAGLASNFRLAKTSADESRGALDNYKATLDATTGSLTEATREMVRHRLVESGRMKDLQALGLNERQVINALIGQKGARKALLSVIAAERRAIDEVDLSRKGEARSILGDYNPAAIGEKNARLKSVEAIMGEIGAVDRAVKVKRSEIQATQDLSALVGKLPRAKLTKIEATGIEPTLKGVARVAKQYDLTAREVKAVLKVTGVEATLGQVQKARKGITSVGDVRPSTNWLQHFRNDIANGKSAASSGGSSIGSALGAGINAGIGSWVGRISASASAAVTHAVQAAKKAGKVKSPSRLMMYVGKMLGLGLSKGIAGTQKVVGLSMDRVMDALEAGVKKKDIGKRLAKHVRKGIRAIEREVGALQKLIAARNDMAGGIAGGLRGEFDLSAITATGEPDEFGFAAKAQPVKAAQAIVARMKDFAAKISALVRAHFPGALVQEIAGMGSLEGGKVATEFLKLSAGERGALMNAYSDIATYSRSIGDTVANQQYGKKIKDQRDVVDRMENAIERGLKKVKIDVQLGVGKRDSAKIYIIGKKEAEDKG